MPSYHDTEPTGKRRGTGIRTWKENTGKMSGMETVQPTMYTGD